MVIPVYLYGVVQYVAVRCVHYYHPSILPSNHRPVIDTRTHEKKLDINKPKWLHIWTANSSFYGREMEMEIAQSPSRYVHTYLAFRDLAYRNIGKKDKMK